MSSNNKRQQQQPSWRNQETRYYCAVCNAWMGNDRQSILLHENGKKHKENVEKSLKAKRDAKVAVDKQQQQLQSSLKAMEAAALQSMTSGTDNLYYDTASLAPHAAATANTVVGVPPMMYAAHAPTSTAAVPPPPPPPPQPQQQKQQPTANKNREKKEWESLKQQRQQEKRKKEQQDDDDDDELANSQKAVKKRRIAPDEGHYTLEDSNTTYLEGPVFYEILEEEMPIQIWIGSQLSGPEERKLQHHQSLWVNGLVVALRQRKKTSSDDEDPIKVNVAYLKSSEDTEETMEQGIALNRIRIVLGGDESIPETLEEARILAMGGEEIQQQQQQDQQQQQELIDEATGLTGWSTVTIKRTTVHQEAREERARERAQQRAARRAAENKAKDAEARKMEESKVANAEDSALGAFHVGMQGGAGYKGVDIHTEAHVTVEDTAKRLAAKGQSVAFKTRKPKFKGKMAGKKQNRRTTSADDDDED